MRKNVSYPISYGHFFKNENTPKCSQGFNLFEFNRMKLEIPKYELLRNK